MTVSGLDPTVFSAAVPAARDQGPTTLAAGTRAPNAMPFPSNIGLSIVGWDGSLLRSRHRGNPLKKRA